MYYVIHSNRLKMNMLYKCSRERKMHAHLMIVYAIQYFLFLQTGTFCGALFTAYMVMFGGFLILFTHMPKYLHWLSYFSFFRYCYDGIITSLYSYERPKLVCPENVIYCHLSSPEYILKEMGVRGDGYWFDFGILLLATVGIRFVAYCTLKKVISSK